ncbi:LPXTG cell wall anchor domain-containing protein [Patescibacteria group bacterium]|nr:LPXTG cell wall anchor domain-containing protein [Patescibacteria group bacterium]
MKKLKKVALSVFIASLISAAAATKVNACGSGTCINYGGGETEIINKRFSIEKEVAKVDEDDWDGDEDDLDFDDKVTDVEKDDVVVFKIKIKNLTSSEDIEDLDIDFDNMKMHDILPDELERIGGSGLTEYWDDFEPGETKTFYIEVEVDEDEYDRDEEFEKCVVNKAKLYWDGEFEGSDTATVCYGDVEVKELPETGSESVLAIAGIAMIATGLMLKRAGKKYSK